MTRVALKGLLGRKTRAILTSLAIVLGVAMISGTFVLTDTMEKAFTGVFGSAYEKTDVVVTGKEIVKGSASPPTVPASLLTQVKAQPGVEAATGTLDGHRPARRRSRRDDRRQRTARASASGSTPGSRASPRSS